MVHKALSPSSRYPRLGALSWIIPLACFVVTTSRIYIIYVLHATDSDIPHSCRFHGRRNTSPSRWVNQPTSVCFPDNGSCIKYPPQPVWTLVYCHPLVFAQTDGICPARARCTHSTISACCEHSLAVCSSECPMYDRWSHRPRASSELRRRCGIHQHCDSGVDSNI